MSPSKLIRAGDLFVVLSIYFDGSHTLGKSIALGALAAHEDVWSEFENSWRAVLRDRGGAAYCHMKEAMPLEGEFKNWTAKNRDWLIQGLIDVLAVSSRNRRFRAFSCVVDLEAHRRWKLRRRLPHPERLCIRLIFPQILNWYGDFEEPILNVIDVFFDRGERFIGHVKNDWNSERQRRRYPVLALIRAITEADMRHTPPLQAVDMLAWARNRLAVPPQDLSPLALKPSITVRDPFSAVAKLIFHTLGDGWHFDLNEQLLATRRFPPEGIGPH